MNILPIRKVVLYKHGVGYFERQAEVTGDASIDLHFRAAEMNDVLKSLTTLDLGGGHVSSISYESTRPVEKQLEDISIRLPDHNAMTGLLTQLKGARVALEVGPRKIEGTVTGIETVTRQEGRIAITSPRLVLLVDGALQSYDLLEIKSLAFLDESVRKDLQHLLDILIGAKKKDLKKLTIFGRGKGKRDFLATYTIETPVWKTSYRMLLGDKKPLIQGWALVDNTQDEDWDDVSLTLVAGLPVSFIHDLYSPRYKQRPIVQVQEEEAYAPPVVETATESMLSDDEMPAAEMAAAGPAPASPPRSMAKKADMADRRAAREKSVKVQTRTVEVGDLFQYQIRNPVTVKRNQSALVPILQGDFDGKRVAVYNPEVREKNPMSAVLFKNTTGMTLEGGPVTVLENESYVGESMLDTLKPGDERLVPYSVELGCSVTLDHKSQRGEVRKAVIAHGTLTLKRWQFERRIYVVRNKTDRKLDLFVEHRFHHGWDLVETDKPVETTENFHRFRFDVAPGKTVKFVVSERGDEEEEFELSDVDRAQVRVWLESRYIDRKTMEVLHGFLALSEKIASLEKKIEQKEGQVQEIFSDQERVRGNLSSLGSGTSERALRERYIAQMSRQEEKLGALRAEVAELQEEKGEAEEELESKVEALRFEAAL